jgi:hypothetical protein
MIPRKTLCLATVMQQEILMTGDFTEEKDPFLLFAR